MPITSPTNKLPAMRHDYNENSKGQKQILDLAMPFIDLAIEAHDADLPKKGISLTIADFGASTGANSSAGLAYIVDGFRRKYGEEKTRSILTIHNDLPKNNWNELFTYVHCNTNSYLGKHNGVKALAAGESFYEQILPDESLHFGLSMVSLHWISKIPCQLENHCFPALGSPLEIELYKQQAAKDWETFLQARSAELVSGGVLMLHIMTEADKGLSVVSNAFYNGMVQMFEAGELSRQELLDFNLRIVYRSVDEATDAQLLDKLGLEVVVAEDAPSIPNMFYQFYLMHRDMQRWSREAVPIMMAVFEPSLLEALAPSRSEDNRREIIGKISTAFGDAMMKTNPEDFALINGNAFVVLKKK